MWFQSGLGNSEVRPSQGELLLHAPQGLSALHQLLLLIWLQSHVNHICQAAVAQDAGDAQEDLIFHSMHALSGEHMKGAQQGQVRVSGSFQNV